MNINMDKPQTWYGYGHGYVYYSRSQVCFAIAENLAVVRTCISKADVWREYLYSDTPTLYVLIERDRRRK